MMSVTLFTDFTISSIVAPASATSFDPASTLSTESPIKPLISWHALRSSAPAPHLGRHHRKPATLLPGTRSLDRRVQRKNVGLERDPSITLMMSTIFFDAVVIDSIVPTTSPTTVRPSPQSGSPSPPVGSPVARCPRSASPST